MDTAASIPFAGSHLHGKSRTHPLVIIGGILQQNPFFVTPDEFLRERRAQRA